MTMNRAKSYEEYENKRKEETKLWNVFEETCDIDKSVSEKKYDRSLLKKYKVLKVILLILYTQNFHYRIDSGFNYCHHILGDFGSRHCGKRSNFLHG